MVSYRERVGRILFFSLLLLPVMSSSLPHLGAQEEEKLIDPAKVKVENLPDEFWWIPTFGLDTPYWITVEKKGDPIVYTILEYHKGLMLHRLRPGATLSEAHMKYLVHRDDGRLALRYSVFCLMRLDTSATRAPEGPQQAPEEVRRFRASVWVATYIQGAPRPNQFYTDAYEAETDEIVAALDAMTAEEERMKDIEERKGPRVGMARTQKK